MTVPLDTGADHPWRTRQVVRLKEAVKFRLGRGVPVTPYASGYLVVPVLGQSNAQGSGVRERRTSRCTRSCTSGRPRGGRAAPWSRAPTRCSTPRRRPGCRSRSRSPSGSPTTRVSPCCSCRAPGATRRSRSRTGFTWDKDAKARVNLHRRGVAAVEAALAAHPGSRVAAILWHQGESDVPLSTGEVYRDKLDALVVDLRERWGEDVPFLLGGMVPEEMAQGHPNYAAIHAVHVDTPRRHRRVAFAEGPHDSYVSAVDRHYSAAGQRELGRRLWDAYVDLAP